MTVTAIKNAMCQIIKTAIEFQHAHQKNKGTSFSQKDIAFYTQKETAFFDAVNQYQIAVIEFTASLLLDKIEVNKKENEDGE